MTGRVTGEILQNPQGAIAQLLIRNRYIYHAIAVTHACTITPVERMFNASLFAVPALRRVDPASTSGPTKGEYQYQPQR